MSDATKIHGTQSLAPDSPSDVIALPDESFSGERCWYHFQSIAAGFQLCNASGDILGIPITTTTEVVGPFRLSSAPTFCYTAAGATTAVMTLIIEA